MEEKVKYPRYFIESDIRRGESSAFLMYIVISETEYIYVNKHNERIKYKIDKPMLNWLNDPEWSKEISAPEAALLSTTSTLKG